jgi:hypothetical protein
MLYAISYHARVLHAAFSAPLRREGVLFSIRCVTAGGSLTTSSPS